MIRILPIVGVIGLMLYTFFDVLSTPGHRFQSLSKGVWLLVALLPVVGGVLWLAVGRPRRSRSGDSVVRLTRRDRTVAPDDDPEFLRQLEDRTWRAKRDAANRAAEQGPAEQGPTESAPAGEAAPTEQSAADDESDTDPSDPQAASDDDTRQPTGDRRPGE